MDKSEQAFKKISKKYTEDQEAKAHHRAMDELGDSYPSLLPVGLSTGTGSLAGGIAALLSTVNKGKALRGLATGAGALAGTIGGFSLGSRYHEDRVQKKLKDLGYKYDEEGNIKYIPEKYLNNKKEASMDKATKVFEKLAFDSQGYYLNPEKRTYQNIYSWTRRDKDFVKRRLKGRSGSETVGYEMTPMGGGDGSTTETTVGKLRKKLKNKKDKEVASGTLSFERKLKDADPQTLRNVLKSHSENRNKKILGTIPIPFTERRVHPYKGKVEGKSKEELLKLVNNG